MTSIISWYDNNHMKKELSISIVIAVILIGIVIVNNKQSSTKMTPTPTPTTTINNPTSSITTLEIKKHNSATDCWIVVKGNVYDVTSYLSIHPGGSEEVIKTCGTDASVAYDAIKEGRGHSKIADDDLFSLLIGTVQ